MGLDDLARKAREAWQHEKVRSALRSEKAEGVSDSVLDKAAQTANRATGGKYGERIADARHAADQRIGTPTGTEPPSTPDPSTPDPEPERNPEPGTVPAPGTVPGAPTDPTVPPTEPPTEPPTAPPIEPPDRATGAAGRA